MELYAYCGSQVAIAKKTFEITYSSPEVAHTLPKLSVSIKNGILTYKKVKNANYHSLYIDGVRHNLNSTKFYLNKEIDWLIGNGSIEKKSSYQFIFIASKEDVFEETDKYLASWRKEYTYNSSYSKQTSIDPITGIRVEKGVLKWDAVKFANEYWVNIDDDVIKVTSKNQLDLNQAIHDLYYRHTEIDEDYGYVVKNHYPIQIRAVYVSIFHENDEFYDIAAGTYDYTFQKESNPLKVSGKKAKVKYKKLKKKTQTLAASKVINGLGTARGKKTFVKKSGNKKIKINKYTGKVTIKKGLKKKTYKVKISVKAAGNQGYNPSSTKTVTIKIKVK